MLTTAANNALTMNVTVPDGVEATATDGNVTLTGIVGFGTERAAAERAVAGLTGVRNIRDYIEISYDADPVDVDLHVQEALDRSALIPDGSDVDTGPRAAPYTDRPRPHLGRACRGGRRCLDGARRPRGPRRSGHHGLTAESQDPPRGFSPCGTTLIRNGSPCWNCASS